MKVCIFKWNVRELRDSRTLFQVAAAVTRWTGKNSPSSDFSLFWTRNKVVWGRTGGNDDFSTVSFQKKLPLLDSVVF